ncbi:MAG TPA: serine/threonine-protein kinase [Ktedonobacterales bacterium]|nr:serine/threonine-protein kinase [Ktedonobacterales bacterium]
MQPSPHPPAPARSPLPALAPQPQPYPQPPAPAIPVPAPLAAGTLLAGRYRIAGYIGGGGFAHIYDAHDSVLGHRRAIKEAFAQDPHTRRQFQLEAEFLLNARHPNLVRGYAVFEQGGRFYLAMDYVDGATVEELAIQHIHTTGQPLPEARVLEWMLPICDAARKLHAQPVPIIHRDIKPANIKLTHEGVPMLIDLGLAKLYANGTRTIGAALAFTPGYAPPEQYQASGATDQRTDVYALGATLYFLLTGYQPTEAPARLSARALPPPRTLNPLVSPATEAAVMRSMALDPARRPQTAAALMAELRAARAELDLQLSTIEAAPRPALARLSAAPAHAANLANPAADASAAQHPYGPRVAALLGIPAAVSRLLAARTPAESGEAQTAIVSLLAAVMFTLSALAVVWGWTLVLDVPGLALAALSRTRWTPRTPTDLKAITVFSGFLCLLWPALWFVFHLLHG